MKIPHEIAAGLLEIEAVKVQPKEPFTWTSGLKSPIYCDNRKTLTSVKLRTLILDSFVTHIKTNYTEVEAIGGIATAGIAQGALIAQEMNLPYFYVRPEPKKHGMKNQIEGHLQEGSKVILIEDLISTGLSSLKAVDAVRKHNSEVLEVLSIFTYGFHKSADAFKNANCSYTSLSNLDALLEVAKDGNKINEAEFNSLLEWQKDIQKWSNDHS